MNCLTNAGCGYEPAHRFALARRANRVRSSQCLHHPAIRIGPDTGQSFAHARMKAVTRPRSALTDVRTSVGLFLNVADNPKPFSFCSPAGSLPERVNAHLTARATRLEFHSNGTTKRLRRGSTCRHTLPR